MSTRPQNGMINFLAGLAILLFILYLFFSAIIDKLNSVNTDLGKAVVGGMIAVVVAVISLVLGKLWEQRIQIKQDVRSKKIIVYEEQFSVLFDVLKASKSGVLDDDKNQLSQKFLMFTERLLIWGSPEVIKSWTHFRSNKEDTKVISLLENFIRQLRIDIGNSNGNLSSNELMGLFVNDLSDADSTGPV